VKCEWARTPWKKMLGLMFRPGVTTPLVLEVGSESRIGASIHMMFMRFPIDAVFLDKHCRVVDKATLKPWTLNYTPKKPAKYVVEMRAGTAKALRLGQRLTLE
jgi:hypothetical protein